MNSSILRAFALVFCAAASVHAQRLIGEGDSWRYYKGWSTPPVQGALNWTQPGFDDSGWGPPSPSGFGFGDGDDATVFNDMMNGYASVYLRKSFVADPAAISHLTLAVDYDDGFVAYLNGVEIARRNMPANPIDHTTLATANHEASRGTAASDPQEKEFITVDKSLLVAGSNVLAIEGHNISLGSTDFSLIPELYAGVNLVRGPYLQMPNATGMTIVWRTDALTDSSVDWGLDATYSGGTVSNATLVTEHVIALPNLQPNETYFYRVRSAGVTLYSGTLRSRRTAAEPFRFSVIGDFGSASTGSAEIAHRVGLSNCDLLLTVGDNIYDPPGSSGTGQPGVYDAYWFTPYAATMRQAPTFPTLGNHDLETANGAWYLKYFRLPQNGPATELERDYSFDYGNAHFVVVDANPFVNTIDGTGQRQGAIKNWLNADLAATTQRWKFVFFHQPAYTSSGTGVHSPETILQNELQPIFAQHSVQMVFQGHNHFYERINPINGVNYITTGAGGRSLNHPAVVPPYSAVLKDAVHSFSQVDMNGGRLTLREIDSAGNQVDFYTLDLDHPFAIDGLLDASAFPRATNPNGLKLYAAIRGNFLYVATQDAGEGSDHFIYLNSQSAALRPANWSKAGQVVGWSAFLADENDIGFKGWFNGAEELLTDPAVYAATTSGLNNNGAAANGVLEGTINLPAHFGAFPAQIYMAAAPFASANGGALVSGAQVPEGNGDGDIQASEFLLLNTRDIALDLPVSNAGPDKSVEAGMQVVLSGSASSPSGLPASVAWTQLSGPVVALNNSNQLTASFTFGANVAQQTPLTFRLRVNDTRFDTDDEVTIQLFPMLDSDGDGLSDQEELTGADNSLTSANPTGHVTDPNRRDTDGDGVSDGDEALAGTSPNDVTSVFRIAGIELLGTNIRVTFSSLPGRAYQLQHAPTANGEWTDVGGTIIAAAELTEVVVPANAAQSYLRVRVGQD